MTGRQIVGRSYRIALMTAALAMPVSGAWAQLQSNESQPGGVEARPTAPMPGAPMPSAVMRSVKPQVAPAPVPVPAPAAAVAATPKPAVPTDAKTVKDDGKTDKGGSKKKKSMKKAPAPDSVMSPRSAPSSEAAPTIPGDETRPGGVERVPTVPQPKQ